MGGGGDGESGGNGGEGGGGEGKRRGGGGGGGGGGSPSTCTVKQEALHQPVLWPMCQIAIGLGTAVVAHEGLSLSHSLSALFVCSQLRTMPDPARMALEALQLTQFG